jgi:hypothetical protein
MNPYLEQDDLWLDFHTKFLAAINERLVPQVAARYFVLLEQHIYVHEVPAESARLVGRADLSLAYPRSVGEGPVGAAVLATEAPVVVELTTQDVERIPFLEVRDRHSRALVTVLEMLSPSNKRGDDRKQYLAKRRELLGSTAHLVEIDLLRGGRPMPAEHRPDCDYSVLVSRVESRPRCEFWPIRLRERLPSVPIPLRPGDADAGIDLQEILHRVHDAYGYAYFIYTGSPQPPLAPEDASWARQLVPAAP